MLPVFTAAQGAYLPSLLLLGECMRERGGRVQQRKREGAKRWEKIKLESLKKREEEMGIVASMKREDERMRGSSVERRCRDSG